MLPYGSVKVNEICKLLPQSLQYHRKTNTRAHIQQAISQRLSALAIALPSNGRHHIHYRLQEMAQVVVTVVSLLMAYKRHWTSAGARVDQRQKNWPALTLKLGRARRERCFIDRTNKAAARQAVPLAIHPAIPASHADLRPITTRS